MTPESASQAIMRFQDPNGCVGISLKTQPKEGIFRKAVRRAFLQKIKNTILTFHSNYDNPSRWTSKEIGLPNNWLVRYFNPDVATTLRIERAAEIIKELLEKRYFNFELVE